MERLFIINTTNLHTVKYLHTEAQHKSIHRQTAYHINATTGNIKLMHTHAK